MVSNLKKKQFYFSLVCIAGNIDNIDCLVTGNDNFAMSSSFFKIKVWEKYNPYSATAKISYAK